MNYIHVHLIIALFNCCFCFLSGSIPVAQKWVTHFFHNLLSQLTWSACVHGGCCLHDLLLFLCKWQFPFPVYFIFPSHIMRANLVLYFLPSAGHPVNSHYSHLALKFNTTNFLHFLLAISLLAFRALRNSFIIVKSARSCVCDGACVCVPSAQSCVVFSRLAFLSIAQLLDL